MQIELTIMDTRSAHVVISRDELAAMYLHLASPQLRNRTGHYMRRHPKANRSGASAGDEVGPNAPLESGEEPAKIAIAEHVKQLRDAGILAGPSDAEQVGNERFAIEPVGLVVPISDLASNLLRPCYHRDAWGSPRIFCFEDEPIERRSYWCICFFLRDDRVPSVEFRPLRFDLAMDAVRDAESGADLTAEGLVWAAGVVPLVISGRPLDAGEIARHDYDLRQILGRDAKTEIEQVYAGWYDEWDERVERAVAFHKQQGRPYATFYHSLFGLDQSNNMHIFQTDGTLEGLANDLAGQSIQFGGLLDSGGSCAIYDTWMASFLNHGWYYREPRGAVMVIESTFNQRVPALRKKSWLNRRLGVEECKQSF